MKHYFVILLVFILTLSCSRKNDVVKFDLSANMTGNDINPDFMLNDIIEDIQFVQLEDNTLLGAANPYLCGISENGEYCFADFVNNATINIHDKDGKMLSTFNKKGKGEGEYLYPSLVYYDHENVFVFEKEMKYLYKYDKNGALQSKRKTPDFISSLDPIGGGKFLCRTLEYANGMKYRLLILDSLWNICDQFLPITDTTLFDPMYYNTFLQRTENGYNISVQTAIKNAYYNYDIANNELTELCEFDLGAYKVNPELYQNGWLTQSDYIMSLAPTIVEDYLFTHFQYKSKGFNDIWNIKTGEHIARRMSYNNRDRDKNTFFSYQLPNGKLLKLSCMTTFSYNGKLVLSSAPGKLIDYEIEDINPEGNKVMIIATLKK